MLVGAGALVYGLVLFALALICAGAGDGTYLPFRVFSAPFGLITFSAGFYGVPVLWLVAGGLVLAGRRARNFRAAFVILMCCHYLGVIAVVATTPSAKWSQFFELGPTLNPGIFIGLAFLIYVIGQVVLWRRFCYTRFGDAAMLQQK